MSKHSPLGILAGSGTLPLRLIDACQQQQRPFFVLGFEGNTDMSLYAHVPHASVRLGAIGEAIALLRKHGVQDLALAGAIKRPSWSKLRPDAMGAKLMARLGTKLFAGDDALLTVLLNFMQEEGFRALETEDILQEALAQEGVLGAVQPNAQAQADMAHGLKIAKAIGALDIGQAVIVEHGYVLGVEAAEGTDALIQRCAGLKRETRVGVLVKVKKPKQDGRADLPTIGLRTLEHAYDAGLAGIAVESGSALILDQAALIGRANTLGLFVVGIHAKHE